jgi:glycerophosphoryl diester phosphodiesterase
VARSEPWGRVSGSRTALIGHRGLGCGVVGGHPENTLGSFTAAVELGMSWVETDVRRTSDDELVLAHDAAYGDGACVADLSADQTDRRGTLRLGTLLDELPAGVGVNLDLKSSMDDGLRSPARTTAGLLGPAVAAEVARRPLMVSSFDPSALRLVRAAAPEVSLAWLTWHRFPLETAVAGCAHMDVDVLGVHIGSLARERRTGAVDPAVVARTLSLVHSSGRRLLVWCPEPKSLRVLADCHVDAVVVDGVPEILGALGRTA